jgi:hypothetical protein
MGYRELQERGRMELDQSKLTKDQRSREMFKKVEAFIASRREFDHLETGDTYLRNAIIYCRQRRLPIAQILVVRQQMIDKWK